MKEMAIKPYDICGSIGTAASTNSSKRNTTCRLVKQHFSTDGSTISTVSPYLIKREQNKFKKHEPVSPYVFGDRIQLLSRVTEKKFVQKKAADYMSYFPLAANIYRTNSDELIPTKRTNKKIKKSVLTLPNEPIPGVQICTVSDMNDSEYFSRSNVNCKPRLKRIANKKVRKPRNKNKDFNSYDTNSQQRSKLHINLVSNPADLKTASIGEEKPISYQAGKQDLKSSSLPGRSKIHTVATAPHSVWEMLRNMNRFQFNPSAPMSEESIVIPKKKKVSRKRFNRKDTRIVETCRTEELAYISSYTVGDSSRSLSQASSFDRITVINNNDELNKISNQFENSFLKIRFPKDKKDRLDGNNRIQKRKVKIGNLKNTIQPVSKSRHTELALKNDLNLITPNYSEDNRSSDLVSSAINTDDWQSIPKEMSDKEINSDRKEKNIFANNSIKMKVAGDEVIAAKNRNSCTSLQPNTIPKSTSIYGKKCESTTNPIAIRQIVPKKQKSLLVTTMPSACMLPKLTQTEIKRRLTKMRFPISILAKDQVSSSIELENMDAPQFEGLDKHIWPFMVDWEENIQFTSVETVDKWQNKKELWKLNRMCDSQNCKTNKVNKINNEVAKQISYNAKKPVYDIGSSRNNVISPKENIFQKQKPIAQLRDKMLNLLQKKSSPKSTENECKVIVCRPINDNMDIETGLEVKSTTKIKDFSTPRGHKSPVPYINRKSIIGFNQPWAKAKKASDYIENVIKNIRNGIYYNKAQCRKYEKRKFMKDLTDVAMQTEHSSDQEHFYANNFSPKVTIKNKKTTTVIPGFDSSLHGLEIKTLNMKQIAIKHCVTNVMIQFDVTVPVEIHKINVKPKTSILLMPIEITESPMKIFKCKTTILNAKLPAELCSIIPRMLTMINPALKSSKHCSGLNDKTVSNLSTITEISRMEVTASESVKCLEFLVKSLSPLKKILDGMFTKPCKLANHLTVPKYNLTANCECQLQIDLLPTLSFHNTFVDLPANIKLFSSLRRDAITNTPNVLPLAAKNLLTPSKDFICNALEVYSTKNKRLISAFKPYNFVDFIKNVLKTQVFYTWPNGDMVVNFNMYINTNIANLTIVAEFLNMLQVIKHDDPPTKRIESNKSSTKLDCNIIKQQSERLNKVTNNKIKRKSYSRLYRKCKSTTSIPTTEKYGTISLNKIQTLGDFLQVLGSRHVLSSIFDDYAEKKILSSIAEMKNWITEINPRQAMLILLLTNKKDTSNLIRFRPILLQGIAVNRITRTTELDMEIEVIERENLHKLSQYEGISYLPDSIENHDQLLEELYWIAKTTASDYQKPFNESSEKLLKSLLEKRKKLNPSYLRVMARYVGLGLLKTPSKKKCT